MNIANLERLKQLLEYDQDTGLFKWRLYRSGPSGKGTIAGYLHTSGYRRIKIDGKQHLAHRLAWLYVNGRYPDECIDHINGIRDDNRIANLRDVSPAINAQNKRKAFTGSSTGLLGVTKNGPSFQAQIEISGKPKYLGLHKTPELAHEAYVTAKREIHPGGTL